VGSGDGREGWSFGQSSGRPICRREAFGGVIACNQTSYQARKIFFNPVDTCDTQRETSSVDQAEFGLPHIARRVTCHGKNDIVDASITITLALP